MMQQKRNSFIKPKEDGVMRRNQTVGFFGSIQETLPCNSDLKQVSPAPLPRRQGEASTMFGTQQPFSTNFNETIKQYQNPSCQRKLGTTMFTNNYSNSTTNNNTTTLATPITSNRQYFEKTQYAQQQPHRLSFSSTPKGINCMEQQQQQQQLSPQTIVTAGTLNRTPIPLEISPFSKPIALNPFSYRTPNQINGQSGMLATDLSSQSLSNHNNNNNKSQNSQQQFHSSSSTQQFSQHFRPPRLGSNSPKTHGSVAGSHTAVVMTSLSLAATEEELKSAGKYSMLQTNRQMLSVDESIESGVRYRQNSQQHQQQHEESSKYIKSGNQLQTVQQSRGEGGIGEVSPTPRVKLDFSEGEYVRMEMPSANPLMKQYKNEKYPEQQYPTQVTLSDVQPNNNNSILLAKFVERASKLSQVMQITSPKVNQKPNEIKIEQQLQQQQQPQKKIQASKSPNNSRIKLSTFVAGQYLSTVENANIKPFSIAKQIGSYSKKAELITTTTTTTEQRFGGFQCSTQNQSILPDLLQSEDNSMSIEEEHLRDSRLLDEKVSKMNFIANSSSKSFVLNNSQQECIQVRCQFCLNSQAIPVARIIASIKEIVQLHNKEFDYFKEISTKPQLPGIKNSSISSIQEQLIELKQQFDSIEIARQSQLISRPSQQSCQSSDSGLVGGVAATSFKENHSEIHEEMGKQMKKKAQFDTIKQGDQSLETQISSPREIVHRSSSPSDRIIKQMESKIKEKENNIVELKERIDGLSEYIKNLESQTADQRAIIEINNLNQKSQELENHNLLKNITNVLSLKLKSISN